MARCLLGLREEQGMARAFSSLIVFACSAVVLSGCATQRETHAPDVVKGSSESDMAAGFLIKNMRVEDQVRAYVVYVPPAYTPDKAWPLVVFLHGIGERGDDGLFQTEVGIGRAIRRHPERFPCLVLMPQCPKTCLWHRAMNGVEIAMAQTREEYAIDPARIYLTGLSMGGFATWQYGATRLDTFAALMPICGGGHIEDAQKLATVPIWAFHGADDSTVSPKKSREMVQAIKQAGGDIQYTEYPDTGHNSWDKAYDDPAAIAWLLKQRKAQASGE